MTRDLSRRGFLAGLGLAAGGLAIGVRGGRAFRIADAGAAPGDAALAPNPFVHRAGRRRARGLMVVASAPMPRVRWRSPSATSSIAAYAIAPPVLRTPRSKS